MTVIPPELMFWFGLVLKTAMTATIVVAASVVVERSGPFIGALIAALPTAAGAAYIILALEHSPSFIAASAVGSIAANAAVGVFALTYAALAQRRGLVVSLGGAVVIWFVCAALLRAVNWTPLGALVLNAVVFAATISAGTRFRSEGMSRGRIKVDRFDIAWRAATVAFCVVVVTTLSHSIGSFASGMFAVFPVAMGSFFVILHPRIGGPAAASVAAHVQAPLIGLGLGFVAVHYLAEPVGVWWAYGAGLAIGIGWNALLWLYRNRAARPAA
jgi:uncharacterized membrane protein (GlpM family)